MPDSPGEHEGPSFQVSVPRVDFQLLGVQDVLDHEQGQLSRGARGTIERTVEGEWPAYKEHEVMTDIVTRQVCTVPRDWDWRRPEFQQQAQSIVREQRPLVLVTAASRDSYKQASMESVLTQQCDLQGQTLILGVGMKQGKACENLTLGTFVVLVGRDGDPKATGVVTSVPKIEYKCQEIRSRNEKRRIRGFGEVLE